VNKAIPFHAVANQLLDTDDAQVVLRRHDLEFGKPGHAPVFVHDFYNNSGWTASCKTSQVNGRFGMPCAAKYATRASAQWEYVPRPAKVRTDRIGVGQGIDGFGAILGGYSSTNSMAFKVYAHGKCGLVGVCIALNHGMQVELVAALVHEWNAYESSCVRGHEVDGFGAYSLCQGHKVALVFAVFVVNDNDHLAGP
jgi:hypothetical protein